MLLVATEMCLHFSSELFVVDVMVLHVDIT